MATKVVHAFGTAAEIEAQVPEITPEFTLEAYDGRASAAIAAGGGTVAFTDIAPPNVSPAESKGSLLVTSGPGENGNGSRFGARTVLLGGPWDISSAVEIAVWVKFNASAFGNISGSGTANRITLYSSYPTEFFLWYYTAAQVGAADTWAELVRDPQLPDSASPSPDLASIEQVSVDWAANPNPTVGDEELYLDTFSARQTAGPGATIIDLDFHPVGSGPDGPRAHLWGALDDGT